MIVYNEMSTINDLNNIFVKEWERKAKEDNLEFFGNVLQSILLDYISGNKINKRIVNFGPDASLDTYEMKYENYIDLIPFIKEKAGLLIDFPGKTFKNFSTVKSFLIYVLKNCEIDPETEIINFAEYFFKMEMYGTLYNMAHDFISTLNSKQIDKIKIRIDFLQSIINRGFSYSSEKIAYVHSLGIKYDRFEFEKMILPVIQEGKVAEFLLITILYRVLEILASNIENQTIEHAPGFIKQRVMKKLKQGDSDFTLKDIGIYTVKQLANNFDKFFRLSIKYLPNEKEELIHISTVKQLFDFIFDIFERELENVQ